MHGASQRHIKIEDAGEGVKNDDQRNGDFRCGVDPGVDQRQVKGQQFRGQRFTDQRAAKHRAENDRADGKTLDPAVGDDQFVMRQVLGKDAVFGR